MKKWTIILALTILLTACSTEAGTSEDELYQTDEIQSIVEDMQTTIDEMDDKISDLESQNEDLQWELDDVDSRLMDVELEQDLDF